MLVSVIDKVKKKTQKAGKLHQQGRHEHLRKIVEITEKYNTKEEKKRMGNTKTTSLAGKRIFKKHSMWRGLS